MLVTQDKPKKRSVWGGLFGLLDKLQLKDSVTRNFIFRPPKTSYDFVSKSSIYHDSSPGFEFQLREGKVEIKEEHIKLKAFKLYRERKNRLYMVPVLMIRNYKKESDFMMIYSHGNSCDLGTFYKSMISFSNLLKMDIIIYDYTGYGISSNKPSEENTYRDIETVLSFVVGKLNHPLNKIILAGFSLGSGPTVEMATRFQSIPFIALFAPMASCLSMLSKAKQGSQHDIFNNVGKMPKVWGDILIVHGKNDHTISHKHSQELMGAYISSHSNNKAYLLEVDGADHQNLFCGLDYQDSEYAESFMQVFNKLLAATNSYQRSREKQNKASKKEEKKVMKDTQAESVGEDEEEAKGIRERCKVVKKVSEDDEEDGENGGVKVNEPEWNSSVIGMEDKSKTYSLLKYETEYLRDLYIKISLNSKPDKWKKTEQAEKAEKAESSANANQFLLYRKSMF